MSTESVAQPAPAPLVLYPPTREWVLIVLGAGAVVLVGVVLGLGADAAMWRCLGAIVAICAAVIGIAALVHLIPNTSYLRAGPEGITVRSLWQTTRYRWVDFSTFGVVRFRTEQAGIRQEHCRVGFNFSRYAPDLTRLSSFERLRRPVDGFEAALPESYGMDCRELAALLNRLRDEYMGHAPR